MIVSWQMFDSGATFRFRLQQIRHSFRLKLKQRLPNKLSGLIPAVATDYSDHVVTTFASILRVTAPLLIERLVDEQTPLVLAAG
jgi:hypothetical protein